MTKKLNLFVFVDALGWDLMQRYPFLNDLLPVRAPLETIFGYSSSCDPTFLTGVMPQDHGHFTFYYYDPKRSPFRLYPVFRLLPKFLSSRARVRNQISKQMKRVHGYTGYFQLYNMPFDRLRYFNYAEKKDIWRPGGVVGGQKIIFERLREAGVDEHLSDWNVPEHERIARLHKALDTDPPEFAFLFLGTLDGVLHYVGTDHPSVTSKLEEYEQTLREIHAKAQGVFDDVRIAVFSDHGMTDITESLDLMNVIERLGLAFGDDYAAAYDSTMARFWFHNDRARATVTNALETQSGGRILTTEELARWGCDFADNKYGELFFLLDPGVLLCPSFMGERPVAGMHGYDPAHPTSTAALLTNMDMPLPTRLDGMFDMMLEAALGKTDTADARP